MEPTQAPEVHVEAMYHHVSPIGGNLPSLDGARRTPAWKAVKASKVPSILERSHAQIPVGRCLADGPLWGGLSWLEGAE